MTIGLGRWRSRIVAGACVVYAATVALIGFAPALVAMWRFTRPAAGHGVASISADNTLMMHIRFTSTALPTWQGSINVGTLALWMLGPPILLWLAWLANGRRRAVPTFDSGDRAGEMESLMGPELTIAPYTSGREKVRQNPQDG